MTTSPVDSLLNNTEAVSQLAQALTGTNDPAVVEQKLRTTMGALANIVANVAPKIPPAPTVTVNTPAGVDPACTVDGIGEVKYVTTPIFGYNESQLDQITQTFTAFGDLFVNEPADPIAQALVKFLAMLAGVFAMLSQSGAVYYRAGVNWFNQNYPTVPTPPAELADQVVRNVTDLKTATAEAGISGMDANRFYNMYMNTGEPPGIMEELSLWRRKLITTEWMHRVLEYSRIRPEYFCDILNLAHQPMSGADAVDGYVKGTPVSPQNFTDASFTPPPAGSTQAQINDNFFQQAFERAGGLSYEWDLLKTMAGDAIGVMQAINLWNHYADTGVTVEQVNEVLGRSRINPIFYPLARELRHKWLTPMQIHQALNAGSIDQPTAETWLKEDGYNDAQAAAFSKAKSSTAATKAKEETEAQLMDLYQSGLIQSSDFQTGMTHLGYDPEAIQFLQELGNAKKILAAQGSAMTHVRDAFEKQRIDATKASQDLIALGIPPDTCTKMVADWAVERDSVFKELTSAQIGEFAKKGQMGINQALTRWGQMGYDDQDARYLYWHYVGKNPGGLPAPN